jgi:serine/threonine protein kinase
MGAVYLAQDSQLGDRQVAVKEMSQSILYSQQAQNAVENFKREAHLLASLQHPNLPSIYDHFEEGGRWYLVMSFIQGGTLADYLEHAHEHKLRLEETLRIGDALCDVLNYLHAHQPPIIFRDLKPGNIMRTPAGHIYLIDFGIARHFKPGQAKDTASYGSMGYSPPEQYGQAQTTERSDIYSLGATLYECLSGYDPSSSPFRLPPLQSLVPALPNQLVTLITQMLAMDESQRPASVKLVRQELQQAAANPQYPPPPPVQHTPVTPFAPTQYAPPPPPLQHAAGQQVFLPAQPLLNSMAQPRQSKRAFSVVGRVLSVVGRILTIIGMVIGGLSVLLGIFALFVGSEGIVTNLWLGGLFIFLGLMVFFISRIRKSSLPISRARKAKAVVGRFLSILGIIFGVILIILGVIDINTSAGASAIAMGVIVGIEAAVIWLVTRIRRKKTP